MKTKSFFIFITYLGLATFMFLTSLSSVGAKEYAGAFMELGAGAQGAAMGKAFVAAADDAYAAYWNPANLSRLDGMDANSSFGSYYSFINYKVYNFAHNYGSGALAISYVTAQVDGIEATTYSDNRIWDTGHDFGYNASVLSFSHSNDFSSWLGLPTQNLLAGVTGKFIGEGFSDRAGASAWAIDLGLSWQVTEYVRAGLLAQNLIKTDLLWDSPSANQEQLGTNLIIGGASQLRPDLQWTIDFVQFAERDWQVNTGIAYDAWVNTDLDSVLTLRLGSENGNPVLGLGWRYYEFKLDYAYQAAPDKYLESSHLLSLGFAL